MCHVVNFPDWLALLRLLARFFILSQSGLFFVARTFFNRYGFNCGEECSVDRSSNEAAAPKALEAAVQENRIRLCVLDDDNRDGHTKACFVFIDTQ